MRFESDSLRLQRLEASVNALRRDLQRAQAASGFLTALLILTIVSICGAIWWDVLQGRQW